MTKLKKIVSISLLVAMLIISSLLLMACNGSNSADSFNLLNQTITRYKANTDLFDNDVIYGKPTNFYLSNFKSKDSSGNLVEDSNNHIAFVSVGLNFIEENYENLENAKVKYNFSSLNKKVEKMNDSYDKLSQEFASFNSMDSSSDYLIYNGYFARYREAAQEFIDDIYDVAESLGQFVVLKNGDGVQIDNVDMEAFKFYVHYNEFLMIKDYKEFFMTSLAGEKVDNELFNNAQGYLKFDLDAVLNRNFSTKNYKEAKEIKELLSSVDADRKMMLKSLDKFSLQELYKTYDGSLIAYEKNLKNASIYYSFIENYFAEDGILNKLSDDLMKIY